jgi:two-component system, chemotaxis family, CheB/CheR fusion protein
MASSDSYSEEGGEIDARKDDAGRQSTIAELEESRRQLQTLMSNLPGMAYRCLNDRDWTMLFVSHGCQALCGYSAEQLVSGEVRWASLLHPNEEELLWEEVQKAVAERRRFAVEYRIRHADGSWRWVWEQGCGVFEGDELQTIEGFITDITAQKHAEARLKEADAAKDRFLAMLGHELRNPLTAISSATELLEHVEVDDALVERVRTILGRQSSHMKKLVDGLLDVSRISRGKIELDCEPVEVHSLLRGLLQDRSKQLVDRDIELTVDASQDGLWVEGDPVRLSQILDNLLSNALKFSDRSDVISIQATGDDGHAVIDVCDTGHGIEPELLSHIFEPFQQGRQDIARSTGGMGLGLAMARGLVELHGGELEAHSEGPGRGASFKVRLPRIEAPAPAVQPGRAASARRARRILIVEDEPDIAEVFTMLLERLGHQPQVAHTVDEGLAKAEQQPPDLVLCDLGLPGQSGYEFAEAIRAHDELAQTPMAALTGYGGDGVRQRALGAGFDEHVVKPVTMDQLAELCERLCESSAARA